MKQYLLPRKRWGELPEWIALPGERGRAFPRLETDLLFRDGPPCLLPFCPPDGAPTGRGAAVVCPGGNYEFLHPREGPPVAAWLADALGVPTFVLRYRLLPTAGLDQMLADLGGGRSLPNRVAASAPYGCSLCDLGLQPRSTRPSRPRMPEGAATHFRLWGGAAQAPGCAAHPGQAAHSPRAQWEHAVRPCGPAEARRRSPIPQLPTPRRGAPRAAPRQRRAGRGGGLLCGRTSCRVQRRLDGRGAARRPRTRLPLRSRQRGLATRGERRSMRSKCPAGQCLSSAPTPPQDAGAGSGWLDAPRAGD